MPGRTTAFLPSKYVCRAGPRGGSGLLHSCLANASTGSHLRLIDLALGLDSRAISSLVDLCSRSESRLLLERGEEDSCTPLAPQTSNGCASTVALLLARLPEPPLDPRLALRRVSTVSSSRSIIAGKGL